MKAFRGIVGLCEADAVLANKLGLPKFDVNQVPGVQFEKFQACKQYTASICQPFGVQTNRREV